MERIIASKFYNSIDGPYYLNRREAKAQYGSINRRYRNQEAVLVPKLADWPITEHDKSIHLQLVKKKKVSPTAPITIRWNLKIPDILDCSWAHPTIQQLIYWIVTGTLTDAISRHLLANNQNGDSQDGDREDATQGDARQEREDGDQTGPCNEADTLERQESSDRVF